MAYSPTETTTRALRTHLREILAQAARGREIVVTLRGKPYVRIVPIAEGDDSSARYPLRGSVRSIAEDFDAPMPEQREKRSTPPAGRSRQARPAPRRRRK